MADRYIIATDVWGQGAKEFDACVPCQLYKPTPAPSTKQNAPIHPHDQQRAFEFYLQYGVEPVLPHASIVSTSTTALEREIAKDEISLRKSGAR